jgi:hypothetical protein
MITASIPAIEENFPSLPQSRVEESAALNTSPYQLKVKVAS